jgi:hypothetical protein
MVGETVGSEDLVQATVPMSEPISTATRDRRTLEPYGSGAIRGFTEPAARAITIAFWSSS